MFNVKLNAHLNSHGEGELHQSSCKAWMHTKLSAHCITLQFEKSATWFFFCGEVTVYQCKYQTHLHTFRYACLLMALIGNQNEASECVCIFFN